MHLSCGMFAAVSIGLWTKFFILKTASLDFEDFEGSRYLHVERDAGEIVNILTSIKRRIEDQAHLEGLGPGGSGTGSQ